MYTIGLDIGYGDVKVVAISNGQVTHQFKFSSAIARAKKNSIIRDTRIVDLAMPDGSIESVYVGKDALELPSSDIVDITNYALLEAYSPVFVYEALRLAEINQNDVDTLVSGLSVTQLDQSGYFKDRLSMFTVNDNLYSFGNVYLLPQGSGSKLAFDKYGSHYPEIRTESNQYTYVGCDIGFNTLDLFYVSNGKTSPNLFTGLAGEGVMRVAAILKDVIAERHGKSITLREAKQVLDSKVYKLRGKQYDMTDAVDEAINTFKQRLFQLIETNYGDILDKCDFISLFGGGAPLVDPKDPFFRVTLNSPEFYNAIGFALYGSKQ